MKKTILIISILSLLIMGCSEDDASTTPTSTDYTEFLADLPSCVSDCGISSPTSMCTFLGDEDDDSPSSCMEDCSEEDLPPEELQQMCTACLEADDCDEVFMDDSDGDDDDGDDGYDDGDDGDDGDDDGDFPECLEDCGISMFLSPTATCEFFAGDDISCTADCTGDDALMLILFPLMCGTCVADGNCDELFEGDSDDDGE